AAEAIYFLTNSKVTFSSLQRRSSSIFISTLQQGKLSLVNSTMYLDFTLLLLNKSIPFDTDGHVTSAYISQLLVALDKNPNIVSVFSIP
ncbi:MAG: hypothetical protein WBE34_04115, partial [Candidatus Nitrosopolaris sp.]